MAPVARVPTLLALLLAGGCRELYFKPIDTAGPPPVQVVVTASFVQAPLPAVDLLFVIDGSPSMAQELDALSADLPALLGTLDGFGLDWQIGVVGADRTGAHPGWLLGTPYVLTPTVPDPVQHFAQRLPLGVAVDEAGLAAAAMALEQSGPDGANAGFRRPDAALHVVFVSDADDHSAPWDPQPVAAFLDALDATAAPDRPARASALVGDLPTGCTSARGTAQAGARYHEVVAATGGRAHSICAIDFGALLQDLAADSVTLPVRFPLDDAPVPGTVRVQMDGRPVDGWSLDLDDPAVVFDQAPPAGTGIVVTYVFRESAA